MNDHYQALYSSFRWLVPNAFNIAEACCHRWASSSPDSRRIAIYFEDEAGNREVWTFARLAESVNRLANGLVRMGVGRGDRVAIVLGQRPETVVAHMAVYSVGAVALPLSVRLSAEAMERRLHDAEARVAIADDTGRAPLLAAMDRNPALRLVIGIDFADERALPWRSLLARQPAQFHPASTRSAESAMLLYASEPERAPQGVLLSHGALIGTLPGFVASQDWFPRAGDVFWSPADWAGPDGLTHALLPALYFGHAVVAVAGDASPEAACGILERYRVTNTLLAPERLDAIRQAMPQPRERHRLALRALAIPGAASLESGLSGWCREALGVSPNRVFGPPEAGHIVGDSQARWPTRPGSMGRPYPGHQVAVIDPLGKPVATDKVGEIAVNRSDLHGHPDPVLFQEYWRNEAATQAHWSGDWCRTGELARIDADGYLWHAGRAAAGTPADGDLVSSQAMPAAASEPAPEPVPQATLRS